MQLTFSREDSALKAYYEYQRLGMRVDQPFKDGNLWVLNYRVWDEALTMKLRLDRSARWRRKKKIWAK